MLRSCSTILFFLTALSQAEPEPGGGQDHWAFQPVIRPVVPSVGESSWQRNPIDAFLAREHQLRGLSPQAEAPRLLLLRRLYLDLVGIPPTVDELNECLSNRSPAWYEQTVRRLLSDPRHGERWARHWMDIWRYSDWWGLGAQLRNSQKHIWHWRDWIVESLNDDTPYDEMVRLMLAADELHPNDLGKLRATGFLARNYFLFNRPQWMEETVEHVSKAFLGLTMNCAKCHDHKYDPIAQLDFYRMRAFFEPYHVRLDVVPGEPDVAVNGIPRVFDGLLGEPTYLYVRGDEKQPDQSKVIEPGVPESLGFRDLRIEPIKLPVEAWQPGLRAWVLDAHVEAARRRVSAAKTAIVAAEKKVATARATAAKVAAAAAANQPALVTKKTDYLVTQDFEQIDENRWHLFGDHWVHTPGRLERTKDGATRSVVRLLDELPQDFDASLRFTIRGGGWRSVGISFDAAKDDPTQPTSPGYSEQNVYVSAFARGPKIHAAYNDGGKWHYPPGNAVRQLPIELNREYTLRVQVQGRMINAYVDGELVIACRTPLSRRDGFMQVTAFDAVAVLHELKIAALDPATSLFPPGEPQPSPKAAEQTLEIAHAELRVAEASLELAHAELASAEHRAEACRADRSLEPEKYVRAVLAERHAAVAKARQGVLVAEAGLLSAAGDKKATAEKALNAARAALKNAQEQATKEVQPSDQFTQFIGAKWTPTRFKNSGKDDPTVEFGPLSSGRRSGLANWITDRRNPLTARVAVNHIWTRHMGQPLVPTVFDFGRNGGSPTHPELLDWLAAEFMENGWSMKHLHQLVVTSAAYRMGSSLAGGKTNREEDRDNKYWWRRVPIRLQSQVVRDSLLSVAGTLDRTVGGPAVSRSEQEKSRRRSLYFFHSNNERNLFLTTFDEAIVKECYRREQSIRPQQALALTNSALVLDASGKIADRLTSDKPDDSVFVQRAFAVLLGIEASGAEIASSNEALEAWRQLANGSVAHSRARFIWALINHNDFVTLR